MRVRATTSVAYGREVFNPGEEFDVPPDVAEALLKASQVERVEEPELAVKPRTGKVERAIRFGRK